MRLDYDIGEEPPELNYGGLVIREVSGHTCSLQSGMLARTLSSEAELMGSA